MLQKARILPNAGVLWGRLAGHTIRSFGQKAGLGGGDER